jgi:mRNA interferase MazF
MLVPGDLVLAAFPFTDLAQAKRRPCLVLACAESRGDFIVAFVTSGIPARFPKWGVAITPSHPAWPATHLKMPSVVRTDRLCTLNSSVISGRIGLLSPELMRAVREQLMRLFSP